MSDNTPQSSGAPDPWAPPENSGNRVPLEKPGAGAPGGPPANPVHDQPTVTSMPAAPSDAVPGVPSAPGAQGAMGTPGAPGMPGASASYGYPAGGTVPGGAPGEYGYPSAAQYGGANGGYPGYPGYSGPGGWTGQGQPQNGFGITAMVLGILSIPLCLWGIGIVLGVMALIFGILGRKKAARGDATNAGMALSGIITGAVGLAVGIAVLAIMIWAIVQGERSASDDPWGASSLGAGVVVEVAAG